LIYSQSTSFYIYGIDPLNKGKDENVEVNSDGDLVLHYRNHDLNNDGITDYLENLDGIKAPLMIDDLEGGDSR